ncbi:hypothetical protein LSTR_LSTR014677 [Laodelphax striatellus]|uniref:HAP1 N-terminal domain-containing protein n=1 Tax=Laodelphax striatellus TaxID=195883 RepID=A0A482WP92_LAOST|nr:hypothetical protein LSTR_LSTR014677 [Laodelphax striatellus]
MFPWSESCQSQRMRRRRRLSDEERLLDAWHKDLCGGGELPEVEIISLLEEQIPQYKLRADTLTQFIGYENQDWFIPSPALRPEDANTAALTTDQIRETLNYFRECHKLFYCTCSVALTLLIASNSLPFSKCLQW